STDGGSSYSILNDGTFATYPTNTYSWTPTGAQASTDALIQIANTTQSVTDESDAVFTIDAAPASAPFITTWVTADGSITIPTGSGTYDYEIVWTNLDNVGIGDGSDVSQTSDYTISGLAIGDTYRVEISGLFPHMRMIDAPAGGAAELQSIEQWGDIVWGSMSYAFYQCSNVVLNASDVPDLSGVTGMDFMFAEAALLNGDLNGWDVSNVTNLRSTFTGAISFNGAISNWDVSNVTNMAYLFDGASSFNQDISSWNTVSVTDLNATFRGTAVFNQNLNTWDVSNVTNFVSTFSEATSFNQPLNNWNMSSATDLTTMFRDAELFDQDLSGWVFPMATSLSGMFRNTAFNQDISGWDVSNVSDFSFMFWDADNFNQPLDGWDVSSATTLYGMFGDNDAFNQDLNSWVPSSVTTFRFMFRNASVFNGNISNWDISSATTLQEMFTGASSFNQDISGWNTSSVANMNSFLNNAVSFDQDLGSLDMSSVTSASNMLTNAGVSKGNYDATLNGWAIQTLQPSVSLGASGLEYCGGDLSRSTIVDNFSWVFSGDALVCPEVFVDPISTDNLVSLGESSSLSISGTTLSISDGQSVSVTLNGTDLFSGSVSNDSWSAIVDASGLPDGTVTVAISVFDLAGNEAIESTSFDLDNTLPSFTSGTTAAIDENIPATTLVYTATATDASTLTYSLSGTDAASFTLDGTTGELTIDASPDFETQDTYEVTITATDAASNAADLTVT
ncbi:MAG: BspA family leucine-rich repeat surface protein, partial [Ekhidna sp.]|nr:BspA family leucine-rich repeat surface protein [Ekhidna sp.]